jgi:subtilisin family serine protease
MSGKSQGFDIDNDPKPVVPAAFNLPNMIGVAALDSSDQLAEFSNWGKNSIKLGAPGVKIMSTVPGDRYQDTVVDLGSIKATWDGTSMATPFVVGSLAVIWSQDLTQTAQDVKERLLKIVANTSAVSGKVATDGRLDLHQVK